MNRQIKASTNEVFHSIAINFGASREVVEFFMTHLTPKEMGDLKKLASLDGERVKANIKIGGRRELQKLALLFQNALNHAMVTAPTAYHTMAVPPSGLYALRIR